MANFKFRASKFHYPSEPISYLEMGAIEEEQFPNINGMSEKRDFQDDLDCVLHPDEIQVREDQYLPFFGKEIFQDPVEKDKHKLHPIEVVIDHSVLQEMALHGRSKCGEGTELNKLETAGFLAGKLKRDKNGRLWTHIQKSVHTGPTEWGRPDEVTISQDTQLQWDKEIQSQNLVKVGIWHTHPTYEPFQSDSRGWAQGADVEATAFNCQHWWSVSMVVDPYGKDDYDPKLEEQNKVKNAVVGCYKMVAPGDLPEEFQNPLKMRWRSIAFGIRNDGETYE